jgi:cytoskeletal protein CcmA (bactofilin family)
MKAGARVEGDIAAISVVMEQGVFFMGRCTMLEAGSEGVEMGNDYSRQRDHAQT